VPDYTSWRESLHGNSTPLLFQFLECWYAKCGEGEPSSLIIIREKEAMMAPEKEWIAYVNGEYVPQSEAKLSIFDHGILYGDGVFDTWCAWNGYIFKLDEHTERLCRSIHGFQIDMPLSREELKKIIIKVVETNGEKNQYIKCLITRGVGPRPLLSPVGCKTSVVVFSRPYLSSVDPARQGKKVRARITSIRRIPAQCLDPKTKNLNYANFVLAKMEALNAGADEAIMLDIHGFVNEGPGYSVFIAREGKLYTPPAENILYSITRETVFEIAVNDGLEVIETQLIPYDLYTADELFLASTAGGIIPIAEVDGRTISTGMPGPITKRVSKLYFEMMEKGVHGTPYVTK
jgi:branched-chain amino acid aminotransferase